VSEGPTLYELVQVRLDLAEELVAKQQASPELKRAVLDRAKRLRKAATHDLSLTSRQVEQLISDLEAGDLTAYDE
jgi:hypothetical protein